MKKPTQPITVLTIHAENAKGVLARILGTLDQPNYYVTALTMAKTDTIGQVLITVEVDIPESNIKNLLLRMGKIIEVESAWAQPKAAVANLLKTGVFEIDPNKADSQFWQLIQKYGATVTFLGERLLVQKTARAGDLLELYNQLDHAYLKTYSEMILALS